MQIEKTLATLITGIFIGALIAGHRFTWFRYDTGGNAVATKQEGNEGAAQTTKSVPRPSPYIEPKPAISA